ncbi:sensor histidine kinase [Orrella dioscoreae]|uniref:histidine kinase n=2 Tax=root TaxID=1 RepID=A0A1C3K6S6_9BURK|nr:sensor histidine kinase [Orrella dioscoreae]SBT27230.1 Tricarboxylate transport sensor protein TctE [Orrella dioscoreae]SOE46141.1 Tricarboxylate transport sensor protein TctE [Orrella dioscoreae]
MRRPLSPRSLKVTLLSWMVPVLVLVMIGALWLSNRMLKEQVDAAYDRSLAGALRAIDLNISTASGGLSMEQPYLMLEFFELTANGRVHYRVATEDGLAEIGSPALPLPDVLPSPGTPMFYEAVFQEEPVRVAILLRDVDPPLASGHGRLVVQVAESLETRRVFINAMLRRSIERDVVGMIISVLVLVAGVIISLRPLGRLRDGLQRRDPDDLRPIESDELPDEVLPLVDALNQHMARHEAQTQAQRQFLDDASHQLRTPLSILRTQLGYAMRESDPDELRAALHAMQEGLDRAERMTNQMLALARARDAGVARHALDFETVDLRELAHGVLRTLLPAARAKRLDYGLDDGPDSMRIYGVEWLLREALMNLVDNAIRYSPIEGTVSITLSASTHLVEVGVIDTGPGMSEEDIARAGVRFRRGQAGKGKPGAGLGLAIVRTISDLHRARLALQAAQPGPGLHVSWVFRRVAS